MILKVLLFEMGLELFSMIFCEVIDHDYLNFILLLQILLFQIT